MFSICHFCKLTSADLQVPPVDCSEATVGHGLALGVVVGAELLVGQVGQHFHCVKLHFPLLPLVEEEEPEYLFMR